MTLEYLEGVAAALDQQLAGIFTNPEAAKKPVIAHCNAIELLAAKQIVGQLIEHEKVQLISPPGADGPKLD